MTTQSTNVLWHSGALTQEQRSEHYGHRPAVLWFTGLSGSGKSTISVLVEKALVTRGCFAYRLDGDNIRHGLNGDLEFDQEARQENIRRVGEVAKLFADAGALTLSAFISPYRSDRQWVRTLIGEKGFIEVHVATPLEVCEARDPKQLYAKARQGQIKDFTGISAPYEEPEHPELRLDTQAQSAEQCAQQVIDYLSAQGYLGSKSL